MDAAALGLKRIREQKFVMEELADPVTVELVTSTQHKVSLRKVMGVDGARGRHEPERGRDEGAGAGGLIEPMPTMETSHNAQKQMGALEGKIAVVTGGTAGVGRGIASELAQCGVRVFVTGRSVQDGKREDSLITEIRCDHREDEQVAAAFARVAQETGAIDILVNNVWGGYERMLEDGVFTWSKPFWEQPLWRWDAMFDAGVRAHYYASQLAARSMVGHRRGLIVNISFWAAQKYIGNVAYGVSKAATDKMTADMATELRPHGVTVVSLYPGLVRTEKVMQAAAWLDLSNSESPEFIGRAVTALAGDSDVIRHTGEVLVAARLAIEYGFSDIDGKLPRPLTLTDV